MFRSLSLIAVLSLVAGAVSAQNMILSTSSSDYVTTTTFNTVATFDFEIEIAAPLEPGVYTNPEIVSVEYTVSGTLEEPTPSGFTSFTLVRNNLDGTEFYAQGSSLSFEIADSAVLSDGVQVEELVGAGVVLTINAREVGTPRFHPPLFQLNADGTGSIRNSNNEPSSLGTAIAFGAEYITDLVFDAGNTTVITEKPTPPQFGGGGGSAFSPLGLLAIIVLWACVMVVRRRMRVASNATN